MIRSLSFAGLCAWFAGSAGAVMAQTVPADLVRAELISGWPTANGYMAALRLTLAPGWKTYWRSPGEAGIPPSFDWSKSENLGTVTYNWPKPQVFDLNGFRSLGYRDALLLPIEFTRLRPDQPLTIAGRVAIGVCKDICVPASIDVSASLNGQGGDPEPIRAALAQVPQDGRSAGLGPAYCATAPTSDGLRLTTDIPMSSAASGDFTVVELADPLIWVAPVEARSANGRLVQVSDLVPPSAQPFALDLSSVRLTVFASAGEVYELNGCTG